MADFVQLPNGEKLLQPEGMSDAEMATRVWKQYGHLYPDQGGYGQAIGGALQRGAAALPGIPGDIVSGLDWLANKGERMIVGQQEFDRRKAERDATPPTAFQNLTRAITPPDSDATIKAYEGVVGPTYRPPDQRTGEKFVASAAEAIPGAIATGGRSLLGAAGSAVKGALGGLAGEGADQLVAKVLGEDSSLRPAARVVGNIAGFVAPSAIPRAITPNPITPARNASVELLRNEGVTDLRAGRTTGNSKLQYYEEERAPYQAHAADVRAGEQFTEAALRRGGDAAPRATTDVVNNAFTRMGGEFDRLGGNYTAQVDAHMARQMQQAEADYHRLVQAPNRVPAVNDYIQEIATANQRYGGVIPGDVYQSLRSRIEADARQLGHNNEAQTALRGVRGALDDAMERSIAASGNTQDINAFRDVRRQYRNWLVLEKAIDDKSGIITPAKLREASKNVEGARNYRRGTGDFSALAHAGEEAMPNLPQSGTSPRAGARGLGLTPATRGAAVGGAIGSMFGPMGIAAGSAAGFTLPLIAERAAMSRLGQRYLANQALPMPTGPLLPQMARGAGIGLLNMEDDPLRITVRPGGR